MSNTLLTGLELMIVMGGGAKSGRIGEYEFRLTE